MNREAQATPHDSAHLAVSKEEVTRLLDAGHRSLQDDYRKRNEVETVVSACAALGLITADECRLRLLALSSCPGHSDGRVWCAYCGHIPREVRDGE